MKKHFSDEQIISILREIEAGGIRSRTLPQARRFRCHILHLA